jgi:hypothetical protein
MIWSFPKFNWQSSTAVKRKIERRRQALSGSDRVSEAVCLNNSPSGLKLRLSDQVPSRARVLFNCRELGIGGRGMVRYCVPRKAQYEIGVECAAGTGGALFFSGCRNRGPTEELKVERPDYFSLSTSR